MPTVEENRVAWGRTYSWPLKGEEWSLGWGGSESQWFGSLYPRVHRFLPAPLICEIAPGYGRWTHYLKDYCQRLIGIDLSERCVAACRTRFADSTHLSFFTNDGYSLAMVPDGSVDFVFSVDSLVHAEDDVIRSYLEQLAAKLTHDGMGFIHHSNLGDYVDPATGRLPLKFDNSHCRGLTASAQRFAENCERAGLQCVGQEKINWGSDYLNDCFSLFTRAGSKWARTNMVIENRDFMREAHHLAFLVRIYGARLYVPPLENTKLQTR